MSEATVAFTPKENGQTYRSEQASGIFTKLNKILGEVGKVPKSGHNNFHNYDYVKEDDLTEHLRPLLAKHGLALIFNAVELKEMPNSGLAVKTEIMIGDTDGACIVATVWGMAQDKGDKAIWKAMTGAMKYWLYKTFLVSTGDDPERGDDDKNGAAARKTAPPPAQKPAAAPAKAPAPAAKAPATPSTKINVAINSVIEMANPSYKGWFEAVDVEAVSYYVKDLATVNILQAAASTGEILEVWFYTQTKEGRLVRIITGAKKGA